MSKKKKSKAKLSAMMIAEELKKPVLIVLGVSAGNLAGKALEKVIKLDETAEGFQAKALFKPLAQLSTGILGTILLENQNLKLFAGGVAASGVASTIKVFLKKDVLNGFGDVGVGQLFREPINLSIEAYNPSLPQIPNSEYITIENQVGQYNDLSDYQEIGEIGIL